MLCVEKPHLGREGLIEYLDSNGISAVFHYLPLHLSPIGRSMGYIDGQLPVTESISKRLLRLPFYYGMTKDDQDTVVESIQRFFKER